MAAKLQDWPGTGSPSTPDPVGIKINQNPTAATFGSAQTLHPIHFVGFIDH
jgi:hypothetical protein